MANTFCHHCRESIGFGVRFYRTDDGLVHARCEEKRYDEG
jgi:hypothetical protein